MWEQLRDGAGAEKAFISHLFLLASAGDLGGSTYDTIVIPPREGNHGFYWPYIGKKTRVTSENAWFSVETPPQSHFTLH